jgi:hypothetical protein
MRVPNIDFDSLYIENPSSFCYCICLTTHNSTDSLNSTESTLQTQQITVSK